MKKVCFLLMILVFSSFIRAFDIITYEEDWPDNNTAEENAYIAKIVKQKYPGLLFSSQDIANNPDKDFIATSKYVSGLIIDDYFINTKKSTKVVVIKTFSACTSCELIRCIVEENGKLYSCENPSQHFNSLEFVDLKSNNLKQLYFESEWGNGTGGYKEITIFEYKKNKGFKKIFNAQYENWGGIDTGYKNIFRKSISFGKSIPGFYRVITLENLGTHKKEKYHYIFGNYRNFQQSINEFIHFTKQLKKVLLNSLIK